MEQLSGTTSIQNILETTFSVETQKICGVGSGLVGDCGLLFRVRNAKFITEITKTIFSN